MFSLWLQADARFGPGVAMTLPDVVRTWGCRRVAAVVDVGLRNNLHAQNLLENLRDAVRDFSVCENAVAEPDYDYLDRFKSQFDARLDLVIGMGGGSTLDLTKAVSVLVTNPGPAISYRGFDLVKNPGIPVVAIPTTAGTGSEVTPNAVFTDAREQRKLGINTRLYVPRLVLLDPLMTISCPPGVTISAGMDALVHAIESFVARKASPASQLFSREAFRVLIQNLPKVLEHPENVDVRMALQLGAFYAGIALTNSGPGLTGALSYPLGVLFKVPHGMAGAVFLGRVSRYNVSKKAIHYGYLYDLIDGAPALSSLQERALAVCDALDRLAEQLGIPKSLTGFGVRETDADRLAQQTMLLSGAIEQNPVDVSSAEVRELLLSMI